MKKFNLEENHVVVTSTYITKGQWPILYISHDYDEDEGDVWQFHCNNGDFSMEKMQLVSLGTIIRLDPSVQDVSDLPVGYMAKRKSIDELWVYEKEN